MAKSKGGRKKKIELIFDPKDRREFLTGFRKRKQERRQKARDDLEKQVKEERKRIKQEIRDRFQDQFKKSFEPIELEGALKEEEYDTENVTVQIVELSTDEMAKSNNWIGANRPVYEGDQSSEEDSEDDEKNEEEKEEIPGFTVTSTKPSKKSTNSKKTQENENETIDETKAQKKIKKIPEDIKSKRALGQFFAKRATNILKHSKAFQMKNKLERNKSRKKARIGKEKRIKLQNKRDKHKNNSTKSQKKRKVEKKGINNKK